MSSPDSNKITIDSIIENQSQKCSKLNTMDTSSSSAEVTSPDHGTLGNIPVITASSPTSKCSTNDQMKTFDPGEDGGIERLINNHCGNSLSLIKSGTSLLKNSNRNYKAGSKINKLADMLAKRSQNVVEVTENNSSDIITDFTCVPKVEDSVILNNIKNDVDNGKSSNRPNDSFEKTVNGEELGSYRKSRRKSVPNQSCNLNNLQLQSASKSCSDFSKLFPLEENGQPEFNALGGSLTNLQTDESTKKKAVRKNFKNIELSLILPEKKRRSSMRCESLVSSKIVENIKGISSEGSISIDEKDRSSEGPRPIVASSEPSPNLSVRSTKVKKTKKGKQVKSKKLVETSTQTTDVEFISVISPRIQNADGKEVSEEGEKPKVTSECLRCCAQNLNLEPLCKAHEKIHSNKNTKPLIKCQFCSKKLSSLDELKSHCVQKHVDENPCCTNCDERLPAGEESRSHDEKESSPTAKEDDNSQSGVAGDDLSQESKKDETARKSVEVKISKQNGAKTDLKIDVSFESTKKSTISPKNVQKFSPKENRTEEQLLEMEMLFYSHLSGNIKENLANHLDGKIDKNGNPVRTDQITESTESTQVKSKNSNLLSVVTPNVGVPDAQVARAPSPYQTRSKTPNPLPPTAKKFKKLPNWQQKFWEKYNFPTNYRLEHRFWDKNYSNAEKSALYLKDLSCLDIKTQLTMRENIKKLEGIKLAEENSNPVEELKFPDYLSLIPRSSGERPHTESKVDTQSISDHSKGKKTLTKEKDESKRSFKPPDSELPGIKTRRKLSSDNSSLAKKSGPEKGNTDSVKMMTRRQSSIELIKDDKEGGSKKRKGSLDMSGGSQKMTLRRQSSLDNFQGDGASKSEKNDRISEVTLKSVESSPLSPTGSAEISGEWVRPRSYLCGTCCTKFTNLWELEDHKWVSHPNVWCTHYEFEDEKIDKLFQNNEDEGNDVSSSETSKTLSKLKLTDLYKRYLLPHGSLKTAKLVPNTNFPEKCTKCKKNCMNSSEMHKHMLDCGGDTTWFLTMYSSPMTMKRRWRPFGSRRRKQLGRRDLKRNIPSTPSLRSYHYQHRIRTKPGDVESIQKMLANLPEKRARKAINFDEIKTRSQATIHSNRLLRKRLKCSFTNNFLKLKNLSQKGDSKSTTDASSESTPTGSPKRRNRLRESTQLVREESSKRFSRDSSLEAERKLAGTTATTKKKIISSKKKGSDKDQKNKKAKSKKSNVIMNVTREKPATRSNSTVLMDGIEDFGRKTQIGREQTLRIGSETSSQRNDIQSHVKKPKEIIKSGKKVKKKVKTSDTRIRVQSEVSNPEILDSDLPGKLTRKIKALKREDSRDNKKKSHGSSSQERSVLRLKHSSKDKTESTKETKQKVEDSKMAVEETKKVELGSRRSLRLRSLPASDDSLIIFDSFVENDSGLKKEESQKETKGKKPVENPESVSSKKPVKVSNGKSFSPKTGESKGETKDVILEENTGPVRRSSRSLRNSISSDDKQDVLINGILETGNDFCRKTRRISRSMSETMESDIAEDLIVPKKSPRLQNGRNPEKQESLLINEQTSLLRKTRFQTSRLLPIVVQSEDGVSTSRKLDFSRNSDLSEMPILAKVEPIRSKLSGKNEKEIPVLKPAVRERQEEEEESKDDSPTKEEDLVSFEIIKKRRKTTKEVSPLKIVKKVESASWESKNSTNESSRVTDTVSSSLEDISETVKTRRRKMAERALAEVLSSSREKETKNPNDVKKYFLGICPSEIDKGRNDPPDDSSSDSEPLITFVINHSQRGIGKSVEKNGDEPKDKDDVDSPGNKEGDEKTSESVDKSRTKKKKKKKVEKLVERSPISATIPNETQEEVVVEVVSENDEEKEKEIKSSEPKEAEKEEEPEPEPEPIPEVEVSEEEKKETEGEIPKEDTFTIVDLKETPPKVVEESSSSPEEIVSNRISPEPKVVEEEITPPSEPQKYKEEKEEEIPPPTEPETTNIFEENKEIVLPERRSRRISKEIKSTNEFVIDDPLILVDELWSDLDSDSDSSRKKSKKGKKKSSKKKNNEEKKTSDVNLEELLRNFGENKEDKKKGEEESSSSASMILKVVKRTSAKSSLSDVRKEIENRKRSKSYRRLSLTLFRFHKQEWNFGNKGKRLSDVKKAIREEQVETGRRASLPDLPFLAAEIKENPVQVIQCRAQKAKAIKKGHKKTEPKTLDGNIQLKISLPLESIHNMAVFNNNHLTELVVDDQSSQNRLEFFEETLKEECEEMGNDNPMDLLPVKESHISEEEQSFSTEATEETELKNKSKRSEVIDKIFYCEICQTYYYSPSSLKAHKLSNRHKQKESEMLVDKEPPEEIETPRVVKTERNESDFTDVPVPTTENVYEPEREVENFEADKLNEDTLEMPTLEGPFIENVPIRTESKPVVLAPQPPVINSFGGFCQESLKDVQRAIGCTDEEMLILTLLGENTIELENDILDLDSCKDSETKNVGSTTEKAEIENEKANGALSVDLKQRMTSALTCLVNKAVFNLLQKYENATKAGVNPEALSLLGKLSSLSRRRNISQLNELLKKPNEGEPSVGTLNKDQEKREPTISYKYQCTICGSRFEKASTRECHISRSHRSKTKKLSEDSRTGDEEWNDSWSYDTATDDHLGNTNTSQFWCSDCGINFLSPQEVLEHQKAEHQAGEKNAERNKDAGPLQSSTIGSSDEILEGKKTRRRTKLFSSEELDQQRIIANNELRKLDRKFSNKNKGNKIKWGMDALKFTVEKENKVVVVEEEKETTPPDESEKVPVEVKNIDLVPKLNLTRTSNIPEFKVIQKSSLKNRFQKIIDNKLKRRSTRLSQQENEADEAETEVMLVPVVVKKKNKKQKQNRTKRGGESGKAVDVYDFNETESDDEPIIFSHLKKPGASPTKAKLVKGEEGPSKNKADSTTKDLAPDDYDSEDSLPLSVMKKFKTGEEDEEKDEKTSEEGAEKSEGILEQVEYLIEQLENETGSSNKNESQELEKEGGGDLETKEENKVDEYFEEEVSKGDFLESDQQSVQPNVENEFLEVQDAQDGFKTEESFDNPTEEGTLKQEHSPLIEPESSQSTFDEEDSIPLVLMSKKAQLARAVEEKKFIESTDIMDVSMTGIEDVQPYKTEESKNYDEDAVSFPAEPQPAMEECLQPAFSPGENDDDANEKSVKPFENVNGNVIYCRNDSLSDFGSDFSNDGLIDSNFDKFPTQETDESLGKEVTEKEDVVIMCSKGTEEDSSSDDTEKKSPRRKKRFPLLSATIEENNFRKSESPKLNKEVIVRKIWSRKRFAEENTDNDDDSSLLSASANDSSLENIQNDASQTEIEKEIIVKKIWSRKKLDHEGEFADKIDEKLDDVKINQTEISDEVIIKCGPKTKSSPKRRKSKSSANESSKETIMRKIWSGKCTFQTKAALKTYDSDVITDSKENDISEEEPKPRKRGRPSSLSPVKRSKAEEDDDDDKDDLDSLLEEIEREELEKAIRLEFLQLRRSEKANVEILKEGSSPRVGLFKETTLRHKKEKADRKRKKVRKNIKHPRQSTLLKRNKFRKKPIRRVVAIEERTMSEASSRPVSDPTTEPSETSLDKGNETYDSDSKIRNRKHKKHRHKHHHHKHKHKKSKHHKYLVSKHKSKHKFEGVREGGGSLENADSFTILEKICQDIPNQIESEIQFRSRTPKTRLDSESTNLDDKMDDVLSSFSFDENNKTKDCDEPAIGFEDGFTGKETFSTGNENNIYDFVEDVTDFDTDGNKKSLNVNY